MIVRLAAVFAHPDDDAWTIGGTLAMHARELDPTIVLCTSGGNGPIWEPVATRETLAQVRESEQREWCAAIGIPNARVEFFRYTDGDLATVGREELIGRLTSILEEVQPHVVVTVGPDGMTRHADHIRAGEAGGEAFHRARSASDGGSGGFARLYHVALRRSTLPEYYRAARERHLPLGDDETPLNPVGGPDDRVAGDVDVSRVYDVKVEAIARHRSQIGELLRIPRDLQPLHLAHERSGQAWPTRDGDAMVAADLFSGVEKRVTDATVVVVGSIN
ncbi:MAG TPA: PIG-L deacetylase family protein, partial [Actinomycetota bacterium]|nr:PIG-L deacetylase family protein [Actinomycetota bacterium]